jgi:hypothetical protein
MALHEQHKLAVTDFWSLSRNTDAMNKRSLYIAAYDICHSRRLRAALHVRTGSVYRFFP